MLISEGVSVTTGTMDLDTHFWQPLEMWRPFIAPEHESAVVAFHEATDPLSKANSAKSGIDPAVEKKIRERQGNPAVEDPAGAAALDGQRRRLHERGLPVPGVVLLRQ